MTTRGVDPMTTETAEMFMRQRDEALVALAAEQAECKRLRQLAWNVARLGTVASWEADGFEGGPAWDDLYDLGYLQTVSDQSGERWPGITRAGAAYFDTQVAELAPASRDSDLTKEG